MFYLMRFILHQSLVTVVSPKLATNFGDVSKIHILLYGWFFFRFLKIYMWLSMNNHSFPALIVRLRCVSTDLTKNRLETVTYVTFLKL